MCRLTMRDNARFLILRPQLDFLNYAGFIALMASFFSAVVVVAIHQSHETDPSLRIAFYFNWRNQRR